MNANSLLWALAGLICVGPATAQDQGPDLERKTGERIVQVQKLLTKDIIAFKDFPDDMPFVKFLAAFESQLPEESKVWVRVDEEAFGKDWPTIAETRIRFAACNATIRTALRKVISQVPVEMDIAVRPAGIVLTRPQLTAHRMAYDVRDLVEQMPRLLPQLKKSLPDIVEPLPVGDAAGLLARFVLTEVGLQPWETVQVLNGTRLAVFAASGPQTDIAIRLDQLRWSLDNGVVVNARLYAVDRAFYSKRVAPLFAADKDSEARPVVMPIDEALFKEISGQRLVLKGDHARLPADQNAVFLSRLTVYRFVAQPPAEKRPAPVFAHPPPPATGLEGVSFEVHPLISPDRRYLRLRITQRAAQLSALEKAKVLDPATGKEVEVETPTVRKTCVSGTVQLPDQGGFLMPVLYQPSGKGNEDKVWVLVARPFIRIEEEVKQGVNLDAEAIWAGEFPREEKPEAVKPDRRLPANAQVEQILRAIVTDVLTNPDLKSEREFYGTPADKTLALVDCKEFGWPKGFNPNTHGYHLVELNSDPFANQNRVLGIRIDKFDLKQGKIGPMDTPITVVVYNAGGSANGAVLGGCQVSYVPKRVGKRWTVEAHGYFDP
jgi:hypothetical protein